VQKHLINESAGVKTYITVAPLTNPQHQGWTQVRIISTADFSRDPDYEQVKFDMCMDPETFNLFKQTVNSL
jgi:hypothetical protein